MSRTFFDRISRQYTNFIDTLGPNNTKEECEIYNVQSANKRGFRRKGMFYC